MDELEFNLTKLMKEDFGDLGVFFLVREMKKLGYSNISNLSENEKNIFIDDLLENVFSKTMSVQRQAMKKMELESIFTAPVKTSQLNPQEKIQVLLKESSLSETDHLKTNLDEGNNSAEIKIEESISEIKKNISDTKEEIKKYSTQKKDEIKKYPEQKKQEFDSSGRKVLAKPHENYYILLAILITFILFSYLVYDYITTMKNNIPDRDSGKLGVLPLINQSNENIQMPGNPEYENKSMKTGEYLIDEKNLSKLDNITDILDNLNESVVLDTDNNSSNNNNYNSYNRNPDNNASNNTNNNFDYNNFDYNDLNNSAKSINDSNINNYNNNSLPGNLNENNSTATIKPKDIDGDGIPNNLDNDIDGDNISNNIDPDIDGDGILNSIDNDNYSELNPVPNLTNNSWMPFCDNSTIGSIRFSISNNHFYGCNGFEWKQLDN